MSGGSMNYLYLRVTEVAEEMEKDKSDLLRVVFAVHLKKVAKALHDIEWADSGDNAPGSEVQAIMESFATEKELKDARAWLRVLEAKKYNVPRE